MHFITWEGEIIMRILFIAPRMHTNQNPIIKGLVEDNNEVVFAAYTKSFSEDYSIINPAIIKRSILSKIICNFISKKETTNNAETKKLRWYIPSLFWAMKFVRKVKPDLVILRDSSKSSCVFYLICKLLFLKKVILYDQHPLLTRFSRSHKWLFPKVRYSPVLGEGVSPKFDNVFVSNHAYFVPFVYESNFRTIKKSMYPIQILDVGKFRDYKNHTLLIDAIGILLKKGCNKFSLTIVGQSKNSEEAAYLENLKNRIEEYKMGKFVKIFCNIPYKEMNDIYQKNDILVLPSKKEIAGMVVIEAMGNGLCVLSSDANGTAKYTKDIDSDNVFNHQNAHDLANRLLYLIENPNVLDTIKKNSLDYISHNCCYSEYKRIVSFILKKEFKYEWK